MPLPAILCRPYTPPTTATHQLASDCRTSADGAQPTSDNRSEFAIPGSVEAFCVLILMCFTAADVHRSEVLESGCQKSNMGCSPGHSWATRGGDWRPAAVGQSEPDWRLAGGAHGALNTSKLAMRVRFSSPLHIKGLVGGHSLSCNQALPPRQYGSGH